MPYAFVQDVPANNEMYREIRAHLGDQPPVGLVAHIAYEREGGLRYVDVWETEADWDRFRVDHAEPAVDAVLARYGIPHEHSLVTLDDVTVVDVWRRRRDLTGGVAALVGDARYLRLRER